MSEPGSQQDPQFDLSPELYDQLRVIARARMSQERSGHTLQTTALVHEAYVKLVKDRKLDWQDKPTFFRAAGRAMRQILVDHARGQNAIKRGGDKVRVAADVLDLVASGDSDQILALDEALSRMEEQAPDAAEVVRLRFYVGLSIEETADALNSSARTVNRLWTFARAWLWRELNP